MLDLSYDTATVGVCVSCLTEFPARAKKESSPLPGPCYAVRQLCAPEVHSGAVAAVAFAGGAALPLLAAGCSDGVVVLWTLGPKGGFTRCGSRSELHGHEGGVSSLAFAPAQPGVRPACVHRANWCSCVPTVPDSSTGQNWCSCVPTVPNSCVHRVNWCLIISFRGCIIG